MHGWRVCEHAEVSHRGACTSSVRVNTSALIGFQGLMLQALFEKHNSFLRPLKKKGFKEERVTTIGLYDIGKSHDPGIQQEPRRKGPDSI